MINDVVRHEVAGDTFEEVRGDSDSVAGLVLEIAGEFPQVNEEVVSGDFTFIPLEINKNRIDKVKVIIKQKTQQVSLSMKNLQCEVLCLFAFDFIAIVFLPPATVLILQKKRAISILICLNGNMNNLMIPDFLIVLNILFMQKL